jgi:MFS family permease
LLGFSTGAFYALPPVLIMKFYSGDKQKSRLGIANAFASAGGGVMMLVSGLLVGIKWNMPFIIYLLPLVPIILLLIDMPEPKAIEAPPQTADGAKKSGKLSGMIIVNCIVGAATFCLGTVALQTAAAVVIVRLGFTGAHAGIVMPFFNIGAVLLSLLFVLLYNGLKKNLAPVILLLVAAGMFILNGASNIIMVAVAMFLVGSELLMIPTLISDNGKLSTLENGVFATSLLMACFNFGGFFTSPFQFLALKIKPSSIPGEVPEVLLAGIVLVALAVLTFISRLGQKEPRAA